MVQVCLNGTRSAAGGPGVPMSPAEPARSAAEAVAAGATSVHVHPRTPCGHDSLSPRVLAPVLDALRARVRVPVGVTTGAWAEPDPAARLARVRSWTALPDFASVNWHEPGAEEVAAELLARGVGVEAGIWSGTEGARRFADSPLGPVVKLPPSTRRAGLAASGACSGGPPGRRPGGVPGPVPRTGRTGVGARCGEWGHLPRP
ncbi:3-keto-5-aminohexanoate cleavage protein [Streptomyces sp. NPDC018347]|uniref:3-keto-5-aminohexanoate cleavage protein n=1 Tax=Streptomyces sp. NPDC018347 TaxID=3157193 RepID=UPI0033F853C9